MRKLFIFLFVLAIHFSALAQTTTPRLAFINLESGTNILYVWDGQQMLEAGRDVTPFHAPVWSTDGQLAYVAGEAALYVWNGADSLEITSSAQPDYGEPVWSDDGRLAYVSTDDGTRQVYIWDGESRTRVMPEAAGSFQPVWSHDGRLAFEARYNDRRDVFVWDDGALINVSDHETNDSWPTWSGDGRLTFDSYRNPINPDEAQRDIFLWDGRALTNITASAEDDYAAVRWSPDSQHMAFFSHDERLRVWNGSDVQVVGQAQYPLTAWSEDGRLAYMNQSQQLMIWHSDGESSSVAEVALHSTFDWAADGRLTFITTRRVETEMGPFDVEQINIWQDGAATLVGDGYAPSWSADGRLAFIRNLYIGGDIQSPNSLIIFDGEQEVIVLEDALIQFALFWEGGQ